MNIILSIKPKYSQKILNLSKTIELRKNIPNKEIKFVYIYESYPTKKIVAKFSISKILEMEKESFWNIYNKELGISKKEFDKYYENKNNVFAYFIDNLIKIDLNPYEIFDNFKAPQNFLYIKDFL